MKSIEQKLLHEAKEKLKEMTPSPMNTMLQKQSKQDAIKKHIERKQMKAVDVPPTTPGNALIVGVSCLTFFIFLYFISNFFLSLYIQWCPISNPTITRGMFVAAPHVKTQ